MGSNLEYRIYRTHDKAAALERWKGDVGDSLHQDGCSYSGNIGMLAYAEPRFRDLKLETEEQALAQLEGLEKGIPLAVSFRVDEAGAAERQRAISAAYQAQSVAAARAWKAARGAAKFIGCYACGSTVNAAEARTHNGHCPVCNKPDGLLPADAREEIAALEARSQALRDEPPPVDPAGGYWWLIGGWCRS
jgi:hypothetical protein